MTHFVLHSLPGTKNNYTHLLLYNFKVNEYSTHGTGEQ